MPWWSNLGAPEATSEKIKQTMKLKICGMANFEKFIT